MLSTDTSDARLLLETRIEFTKIFLLKYFPYIFFIEGFPQLLISIQSIEIRMSLKSVDCIFITEPTGNNGFDLLLLDTTCTDR